MDDLMQAIEEHSHYDGADEADEDFWQRMWDQHSEEYKAQTAQPSLSDFQVFCEEQGWVPDVL